MKKVFKEFATYIKLHDGHGKPRLDWQHMYRLFPQFEFAPVHNFGDYQNFGQAFECKIYDMVVSDQSGNTCYMNYREYYDTTENLAYVS